MNDESNTYEKKSIKIIRDKTQDNKKQDRLTNY
jgi:hypothetical protein